MIKLKWAVRECKHLSNGTYKITLTPLEKNKSVADEDQGQFRLTWAVPMLPGTIVNIDIRVAGVSEVEMVFPESDGRHPDKWNVK